MKELQEQLTTFFQQEHFTTHLKSGKFDFQVTNFFIRAEKYTKDIILYVHPSVDPALITSLGDRKKIERIILKRMGQFDIEQVIIPYEHFWDVIKEQKSGDYEKELTSFVFKLLYRKLFKLKIYKYNIRFEVHPYMVEDGALRFDVRNFSVYDENHHKRHIDYVYFDNVIEKAVLDRIKHLGVKEAKLTDTKEAAGVLAEQKNPIKFVENKKYNNYLTPAGLMSFMLTEPVMDEEGILHFYVKNFVVHKGDDIFFQVNDQFKPYILRIVNDDIGRYGISDAKFMGQANTTIA